MFAGWLRPHRVLIAVGASAIGALACRDTTTPTEFSKGVTTKPSSAASGFSSMLIGRGNLGPFHVKSKAAGYDVELKSRDNTDIAVANVVVAAGGNSGWHTHPGPVLVVVKTGTITFYHVARSREDGERDSDLTCSRVVHPALTAFVEEGGVVGIARNEGAVEATVVATYFVPPNTPTKTDVAAPGGRNCPP